MKRIISLIVALLLVCLMGCDRKSEKGDYENVNSKVQGPTTVEYGAAAAETPFPTPINCSIVAIKSSQ